MSLLSSILDDEKNRRRATMTVFALLFLLGVLTIVYYTLPRTELPLPVVMPGGQKPPPQPVAVPAKSIAVQPKTVPKPPLPPKGAWAVTVEELSRMKRWTGEVEERLKEKSLQVKYAKAPLPQADKPENGEIDNANNPWTRITQNMGILVSEREQAVDLLYRKVEEEAAQAVAGLPSYENGNALSAVVDWESVNQDIAEHLPAPVNSPTASTHNEQQEFASVLDTWAIVRNDMEGFQEQRAELFRLFEELEQDQP